MNLSAILPNYAWYIAPAFLSLITVVVFIHELGHFLVARLFGVKIETFSIGFGRALVHWHDRYGTQWKIGWIPLGGYVKFFGDADGASTPDREAAAQMNAAERAVAFPFKPLWQRALIVVAGPVANFILAFVILTATFLIGGETTMAPVIGEVTKDSPAALAGFRPGDRVLTIDGETIESFGELGQFVGVSVGHLLPFVVEREGKRVALLVTPRLKVFRDKFNNRQRVGEIGISAPDPALVQQLIPGKPAEKAGLKQGDIIVSINGRPTPKHDDATKIIQANPGKPVTIVISRGGRLSTIVATPVRNDDDKKKGLLGVQLGPPLIVTHPGLLTAAADAVDQIRHILDITFRGLFQSAEGTRQLSGIIGIAKVSGQVASTGWDQLILLAAFLSVSIGLVNLFPIPLLDGGHLLYYGCEAVLGRPLGERAQDVGFRVGLAVVASIFLLATWNDILNLF
jgi:regulator of sigma E protease